MSSPGSDSYESHTRKRVGKACDRCRLKKSKCDGSSPCSRCKADNAICVFGERKKSHDKVYPKGYVEMLEQQQSQLVAGLRAMHESMIKNGTWPGAPLKEHEGYPLTHDILERLNVLHMTGENPTGSDRFEDDLETARDRMMIENGASTARPRRTSPDSESDPGLAHTESRHTTPTSRTSSISSLSFSRKRASPATPPPSEPSAITYPSKHQKYTQAEAEPLPQYWTSEPAVMGSPVFDFTSNLYDASIPLVMSDPSVANAIQSVQSSISLGPYDSEWDSFLNSGLHQVYA